MRNRSVLLHPVRGRGLVKGVRSSSLSCSPKTQATGPLPWSHTSEVPSLALHWLCSSVQAFPECISPSTPYTIGPGSVSSTYISLFLQPFCSQTTLPVCTALGPRDGKEMNVWERGWTKLGPRTWGVHSMHDRLRSILVLGVKWAVICSIY